MKGSCGSIGTTCVLFGEECGSGYKRVQCNTIQKNQKAIQYNKIKMQYNTIRLECNTIQ